MAAQPPLMSSMNLPNPPTDSKLMELQRFELLVSAIHDYAIYMLDAQGHVVSWNTGAARFKGYSADEIIGQHFSQFYLPEDRAAGVPLHALNTAAEKGTFQAEGWRVRKDGSRFWANVVINPIYAADRRLLGFAKPSGVITTWNAGAQRIKGYTQAEVLGTHPELARQAREHLPGIAVLYTSGYTRNAIVHGGRLDPGGGVA